MTTVNAVERVARTREHKSVIPLEEIDEPGAYVLCDFGLLLRVPAEGVARGRSPTLYITGAGPLTVTRVSDDPWIPRSVAKRRAADLGLPVAF